MYDNKKKIDFIYFKKKRRYSNLFLTVIFMFFIFFIFFNIKNKNTSQIRNTDFKKNSKSNILLPPKPKKKWKYIEKLKNL